MKMKLVLPIFIFATIACVGCSKYNKGSNHLQYLSKKYKNISPTSVKLSQPVKLALEDTVAIREAMNLYNRYVGDNGLDFFQKQNRILLKYNLEDVIKMADINGIRIIKGLNIESSGETNQNQIIKFLNLDGTTRITDRKFLVLNGSNGCPYMCDAFFLNTSLPIESTGERIWRNMCEDYQIKYDQSKNIDNIKSIIIPKRILIPMFENNISYFKLYNGITQTNQRIIYLLSYNVSGRLQINDSYSLDETYMCTSYCDNTEYSPLN